MSRKGIIAMSLMAATLCTTNAQNVDFYKPGVG